MHGPLAMPLTLGSEIGGYLSRRRDVSVALGPLLSLIAELHQNRCGDCGTGVRLYSDIYQALLSHVDIINKVLALLLVDIGASPIFMALSRSTSSLKALLEKVTLKGGFTIIMP